MAKRKTGLGVDAFFPDEGLEEEVNKPRKSVPLESPSQQRKKLTKIETPRKRQPSDANTKIIKEEKNERRPAWIRLDHLERLDALKHLERKRLRREKKRVSRSTLIDEAIERYLAEMDK